MEGRKFRCCLCGHEFTGWGNNPWPLATGEEDRCCDQCNELKVIPARITLMFNRKTEVIEEKDRC